jgi:hypothetical protein
MFNIELSLDELSELHVIMHLRKEQLRLELTHANPTIAAIALRQLERISPLCYYLEATMREYHSKEVTA